MLIVLRFVQGVGVGGEWSGSVLLAMEWAKTNAHRGFIASWPQFGSPCGLALANLAVLVFSAISGDQFLTWGWRIPFLLSIIWSGSDSTSGSGSGDAGFRTYSLGRAGRAGPGNRSAQAPAERDHPDGIRPDGEQAPGYIYIAYIFTYGTDSAGLRAISGSSGCWPPPSCQCSGCRSLGISRIALGANACT